MAWYSPRNDCAHPSDPVRLIVGAGGHGRECIGVWRRMLVERGLSPTSEGWVRQFVDDSFPDAATLERIEARWIGSLEQAVERSGSSVEYLLGIGSGSVRSAIASAVPPTWHASVVVDPRASLDDDVRAGVGVVVFAQATLTTNIDLGRHAHIGRGAAIGHDCVIGDFVTVMPLASVSGNVTLGDRATVGSGAVIRQGQSVGADAYVGAGAVVVSDVPPGVTVVGNPARPILRSSR